MQQLFDEIQLANIGMEHNMRELSTPEEAQKVLKEIYSEGKEDEDAKKYNIILDLGINDTQTLFDQQV